MMTERRGTVKEVASQIGSELLPDNATWTNRFQIQSTSSSALYVIAQMRSTGVWGCSCPGWRNYRKCKHVKDVLQRLASVAEKAVFEFDADTVAILVNARTAYLDLEPANKVAAPTVKGRAVDFDDWHEPTHKLKRLRK